MSLMVVEMVGGGDDGSPIAGSSTCKLTRLW